MRPIHPRLEPPNSGRRSEAGSAYVLVLMVLVLLGTLALSLAAVSQNEVILGGHDLQSQRVLYAAESGIHLAAARALVSNDRSAETFRFDDTPEGSSIAQSHEIELTAFVPLRDAPCNLCEINGAGSYNEKAFRAINHVVNSDARRRGPGGQVLGQKRLSVMLEFQPWKSSIAQSAAITQEDLMEIEY